jgi:hypothetical protein
MKKILQLLTIIILFGFSITPSAFAGVVTDGFDFVDTVLFEGKTIFVDISPTPESRPLTNGQYNIGASIGFYFQGNTSDGVDALYEITDQAQYKFRETAKTLYIGELGSQNSYATASQNGAGVIKKDLMLASSGNMGSGYAVNPGRYTVDVVLNNKVVSTINLCLRSFDPSGSNPPIGFVDCNENNVNTGPSPLLVEFADMELLPQYLSPTNALFSGKITVYDSAGVTGQPITKPLNIIGQIVNMATSQIICSSPISDMVFNHNTPRNVSYGTQNFGCNGLTAGTTYQGSFQETISNKISQKVTFTTPSQSSNTGSNASGNSSTGSNNASVQSYSTEETRNENYLGSIGTFTVTRAILNSNNASISINIDASYSKSNTTGATPTAKRIMINILDKNRDITEHLAIVTGTNKISVVITGRNLTKAPFSFTVEDLDLNIETEPIPITSGSGQGNGDGTGNGAGSEGDGTEGSGDDDDATDQDQSDEDAADENPTNNASGTIKFKNPTPFNSIIDLVNAIVKNIVIPVAVPFLALAIMYTGFLFVTAKGNAEKLKKAKEALKWTLIGGAVILASAVIASALQGTINDIIR